MLLDITMNECCVVMRSHCFAERKYDVHVYAHVCTRVCISILVCTSIGVCEDRFSHPKIQCVNMLVCVYVRGEGGG